MSINKTTLTSFNWRYIHNLINISNGVKWWARGLKRYLINTANFSMNFLVWLQPFFPLVALVNQRNRINQWLDKDCFLPVHALWRLVKKNCFHRQFGSNLSISFSRTELLTGQLVLRQWKLNRSQRRCGFKKKSIHFPYLKKRLNHCLISFTVTVSFLWISVDLFW